MCSCVNKGVTLLFVEKFRMTSVTSGSVAVAGLGVFVSESAFWEDARLRVLRLIEADGDLTQRQIAEALGLSLGAVNYCLKGLIEKGAIKANNFRASNAKWRYAYVLTPKGFADRAMLTASYLQRRTSEYEALRVEFGVGALAANNGPITFSNANDTDIARTDDNLKLQCVLKSAYFRDNAIAAATQLKYLHGNQVGSIPKRAWKISTLQIGIKNFLNVSWYSKTLILKHTIGLFWSGRL